MPIKKGSFTNFQIEKAFLPISKLEKLFYQFGKAILPGICCSLRWRESSHTWDIQSVSIQERKYIYGKIIIIGYSIGPFSRVRKSMIYIMGNTMSKIIYHHGQIIKSINWYIRNINISIILSSGILDLSVLVLVQETYKTENIHMMQSTIQILLKIQKIKISYWSKWWCSMVEVE